MDRIRPLPVPGRRDDGKALLIALRPSLEAAWALFCGCLAAGSSPLSGATGFRVLATWLIADVVLGCVLAQLLALKRASLAGDGPTEAASASSSAFVIPYAEPGSPGQRLAEALNGHIAQWKSSIWPRAGRCGVTALVSTGLALVVSTYLGRETLATLSGGLLLAATLTILAGRGIDRFTGSPETALASWLGGLHLALAWALGYLALASWQGPPMAIAALVGLHAYSNIRLRERQGGPALWLLWAIWGILILTLLMARQPILAVPVAMGALAESMFYGALPRDRDYARSYSSRLGWLLAMLCVSLAVTYWP